MREWFVEMVVVAFVIIVLALLGWFFIPEAEAANKDFKTQASVRSFIVETAKIHGVPTQKALWIAEKESRFGFEGQKPNFLIRGDNGNSRGIWQISKIYHPEVSDECSDDVACSTLWAMPRIKENANEWSAWSKRFLWYDDFTEIALK